MAKPPEPYYDDGRVRLYLGRCEDVLPHISGVQLTVTSPPYNLGGGAVAQRAHTTKETQARREAMFYDDDLPEPEYQAQQALVAKLVAEASTPDAAYFYNHKVRYEAKRVLHPLTIVEQFDDWQLRQELIWCRPGGVTHQGGMFVHADERIYWLVRDLGSYRWRKAGVVGLLTWWQMNPPKVGRAGHPVPYPPTIPERAILTATSRGDLVLDPYAGSGTTLRVAKHLGRRAVGIEAREDYAAAAVQLLEGSG